MESGKKLNECGFVRLPTVLKMIPVGKSTWYDGMKKGKYPKQVKITGERAVAWRVGDIKRLMESLDSNVGFDLQPDLIAPLGESADPCVVIQCSAGDSTQ